jgi:hypothetical protein
MRCGLIYIDLLDSSKSKLEQGENYPPRIHDISATRIKYTPRNNGISATRIKDTELLNSEKLAGDSSTCWPYANHKIRDLEEDKKAWTSNASHSLSIQWNYDLISDPSFSDNGGSGPQP